MKNRFRRSLVVSVFGAGMLAASAVPATAAPADSCAYPSSVQEVAGCACVAVVTILRDLTGDPWTCAN